MGKGTFVPHHSTLKWSELPVTNYLEVISSCLQKSLLAHLNFLVDRIVMHEFTQGCCDIVLRGRDTWCFRPKHRRFGPWAMFSLEREDPSKLTQSAPWHWCLEIYSPNVGCKIRNVWKIRTEYCARWIQMGCNATYQPVFVSSTFLWGVNVSNRSNDKLTKVSSDRSTYTEAGCSGQPHKHIPSSRLSLHLAVNRSLVDVRPQLLYVVVITECTRNNNTWNLGWSWWFGATIAK